MRDVTKTYPGVRALDGVALTVRPGEIHGLVGENGAGKSTLVGVAAGTVEPDSGEVWIDGARLTRADPASARESGLAIVHQEPALMADLTVAENMVLGQAPQHRPGWGSAREWAARVLSEWTGTRSIDPATPVRDLSPDRRFIVELSKACAQRPSVLILDEPTEHLVAEDVATLFRVVRGLAAAGTAVVYISHHISEVLEICDRISVLRDGVMQGVLEADEADYGSVVTRIVGRELDAEFPAKRAASEPAETPVLTVSGLNGDGFADVGFDVFPGEIVGLAGVEGNGQREVIRALAGVGSSRGEVSVGGRKVARNRTPAAAGSGIAFVPNDRHREGMLKGLGVRENIAVGVLGRLSRLGIVSRRDERETVGERIRDLRVATPGMDTPIDSLSGGNQQKAVFGRALERRPKVILADEPTQGVDIGARAEIYTLLRGALSDGGAAVVVSSNQAELEGLCDRVLVFSRGRVVKELRGAEVTEHAIVEAALTSTAAREDRTAEKRGTVKKLLGSDFAPPVITLVLTLALALYSWTQNPTFLSNVALSGLLTTFAAFAFASFAQQVVMLVGAIDLSVGPLMGFLGVVASFYLLPGAGAQPFVSGFLLMIGIALVVAALNFVPMLVNIPPLLTTLVTYTALQGLSLLLRPVPGGTFDEGVLDTVATTVGFVPIAAVVAIVLAVMLDVVVRRTTWGVSLRGVGSSPSHARAVGVRVKGIQLSAYLVAGTLVFLAALMLMNQVGAGNANAGVSYTLTSITAVVVGGTSIKGGRGAFAGALTGALLIVVVNSAVTFLDLGTAWQTYLVGILTLAAAGIYSRLRSNNG
ncbi:ATP-binding cassette domain-containing protein [Amycolatopsis rubida]|uniref:ATP-binding cassette domain-containing protein n=2 Tax=Pseudonocardiaceae TaxID=2070 RepID=A0ABX0C7Z7_9PSEU|nr:ATP-binding cassette domain-containing protein [Amycolatopsis rubida]NEC61090.1 ATP-binding cassette domain-containing protein [Amycolatopsis rubida]